MKHITTEALRARISLIEENNKHHKARLSRITYEHEMLDREMAALMQTIAINNDSISLIFDEIERRDQEQEGKDDERH